MAKELQEPDRPRGYHCQGNVDVVTSLLGGGPDCWQASLLLSNHLISHSNSHIIPSSSFTFELLRFGATSVLRVRVNPHAASDFACATAIAEGILSRKAAYESELPGASLDFKVLVFSCSRGCRTTSSILGSYSWSWALSREPLVGSERTTPP